MKIAKALQIIISLGILLALIFIGYQIYLNNQTPKDKMDCLKLNSDIRAAACIKILENKNAEPEKTYKEFPLSNLSIKDLKYTIGQKKGIVIELDHLSGTIVNNYDQAAKNIILRINYYASGNETTPFHYADFQPFKVNEILPAHSQLSFTYQASIRDNRATDFKVVLLSADIQE